MTTISPRERVLASLQHREPDHIPIDLGGMRSTGIMAVAYNRLKAYLGLTDGQTKMFDLMQQLALPEPTVLDRFHVDVVPLPRPSWGLDTDNPRWKPWVLPDGSPAIVPDGFDPIRNERGDWVVLNSEGVMTSRMPAGGLYFDGVDHPLAEATTAEEIENYELSVISDSELDWLRSAARRLSETTDRAIMGEFGGNILESGQGLRGWDRFMIDLALEPKLADALIQKLVDHHLENLSRYLDAVGDTIQIIQMGDDLGTQQGPQLSPAMYRRFIKPAHRQIYDYVKKHSDLFVFLHTCGSIYKLIPDLIEAGVDILNPVQVSAVDMDPARLKHDFGQDVVFWGGGADTQHVLPFADTQEIRDHVRHLIDVFAPGGGFVFCQVHNIQANVPPENVVAMFETAIECGGYPRS
ncbi:MAG: methyltransferase [Chloroflexi bacterium]|nr:methyltransferase [Chloroflexota bacterium]